MTDFSDRADRIRLRLNRTRDDVYGLEAHVAALTNVNTDLVDTMADTVTALTALAESGTIDSFAVAVIDDIIDGLSIAKAGDRPAGANVRPEPPAGHGDYVPRHGMAAAALEFNRRNGGDDRTRAQLDVDLPSEGEA